MQRPVDVKPVTNMVTGYEETPINESRRQKLRNGTCCVRAEKARAGGCLVHHAKEDSDVLQNYEERLYALLVLNKLPK